MNKTMRRNDRQLSDEETVQLFDGAEYGILSLIDEENMPYGVPMSFALCGDAIYFHCSAEGGKRVLSIQQNQNACFTVVDHTQLLPQKFSTLYMSGIAYGTIEAVTDESDKRKGIEAILRKYSPDYIEQGLTYMDRAIDKVCVLKLEVKTMTGKGRKA